MPDSASTAAGVNDLARGVLESHDDQRVVLSVPGTSYRLRLELAEGASIPVAPGRRLRGRLEGRALRLNRASGGGRLIEPLVGAPRIVHGTVAAVDGVANRILLDAVVPMWLTLQPGQSATTFAIGDLLNGYVESGVRFTPQA